MVVLLLLSASLSQAGLLGAGDHQHSVYTRAWLAWGLLQARARAAARRRPTERRPWPGPRAARTTPPAARNTDTATPGTGDTVPHVITRDTHYTRATCRRWSQGEFRDCSGESNGSPLPLSVLTLEYLETLAGRPAAGDSLLLGR